MNFLLVGFSTDKIFHGEGGVVNLTGNILHWGNLPEFICDFLFISLTFSLLTQLYMLRY